MYNKNTKYLKLIVQYHKIEDCLNDIKLKYLTFLVTIVKLVLYITNLKIHIRKKGGTNEEYYIYMKLISFNFSRLIIIIFNIIKYYKNYEINLNSRNTIIILNKKLNYN